MYIAKITDRRCGCGYNIRYYESADRLAEDIRNNPKIFGVVEVEQGATVSVSGKWTEKEFLKRVDKEKGGR